ncbi:MAG: hypothetical protein CM15mP100_5560 [Alphaproteobacteria bacterium]|nr:MAG: hypothetical protein CM15mP100_5560 [Alphaproteobacteria bacterium]
MNEMNSFFNSSLSQTDPEIAAALHDELFRQQDQIEMIASENIVSNAVLEAQGSILTNKYAEGYSGRRYYGGCEYVDVVETLAIDRAKQLFNCNFVMFSLTLAHRRTRQYFLLCFSQVTQCLACLWHREGI